MEFLAFVLNGLAFLVLVDAISSWFVQDSRSFPRNVTAPIAEPLYTPIRSVLKPEMTGGIDFSPMILIIVFQSLARGLATGGFGL